MCQKRYPKDIIYIVRIFKLYIKEKGKYNHLSIQFELELVKKGKIDVCAMIFLRRKRVVC